MNVLDIQMGGTHYKSLLYQPVTLIAKIDLNFIQGNIVKYVSRYRNKNGKEDLMKAMHYAQLGQELNPTNFAPFRANYQEELLHFCKDNHFSSEFHELLSGVVWQNWLSVVAKISKLIKEYD